MRRIRFFEVNLFLCLLHLSLPANAQVIPDTTLPINSNVATEGDNSTISGGTQAGKNLFHSFEQFSVPTGNTVYFNNAADIQNIFSRITGGSISNIDGILRANGTANFFLLNPNGIVFGSNARLNIGGSFLGSTASSIKFADGTQFSAKAPPSTPLLTVSVPVGLGFGSPGEIRVQGNGHNLIGPAFSPVVGLNNSTGLSVQPGKTLALVGGNVALEGSILRAPGGSIELGSVSDGLVSLSSTSSGWNLGYEGTTSKDIQLSQRALVDASSINSGSIQIQGSRVSLSNGSVILLQNQGVQPGGTLSVNASESLEVRGTDPTARIAGSLRSETLGSGRAGNIAISTKHLVLRDGGQINNLTFGIARSGSVDVKASDFVQITGASPVNPNLFSAISAATFKAGDANDITVSTPRLSVEGGGQLSSSTFGLGKGGNVTINASDFVRISGSAPVTFLPSVLSATTLGSGNAGDLEISTSKLTIRDGGRIDTSTLASGKAGDTRIKASEVVEVSGTIFGSDEPSLVLSSASRVSETLQKLFRLPPTPSGDSGSIVIDTKRLDVVRGGLVGVKNDGSGNAGTLQINADSINLGNSGSITAATVSGEGGNIFVRTQNLQLRDGSKITTTAGNRGNGGNITINTDTLATLENSDITANAFQGRGGNIQIATQGLFLSPDSNITASSQFGVDGLVDIRVLGFDAQNAITPQSPNLISTEQVMAGSCLARRNVEQGTFVVTGSGGLPISPFSDISEWESLSGVQPEEDESIQGLQPSNIEQKVASVQPEWKKGDPIVEAQGIIVTADGRTLLGLKPQQVEPFSPQALSCGS